MTDEVDEAQLLTAAREGDQRAYAELWRRHYSAAVTVARPIAKADAEDVASEAFAAVWRQFEKGQGPEQHFRAYLFTSVRNLAYRYGSREMAVPDDEIEAVPDHTVDLDSIFDDEAVKRETRSVFMRLPERYREVLWMLDVDELTVAEAAERLDMPPNTVTVLGKRAREALRIAFLEFHLQASGRVAQVPQVSACERSVSMLPKAVRGTLSKRREQQLADHLAECRNCQSKHERAARINQRYLVGAAAAVMIPAAFGITQMATAPVAVAAASVGVTSGVSAAAVKITAAAASVALVAAVVGSALWAAPAQSEPPVAKPVVAEAREPVPTPTPTKPAPTTEPPEEAEPDPEPAPAPAQVAEPAPASTPPPPAAPPPPPAPPALAPPEFLGLAGPAGGPQVAMFIGEPGEALCATLDGASYQLALDAGGTASLSLTAAPAAGATLNYEYCNGGGSGSYTF